MKDFLSEIFTDPILSILTKKYGTKLSDSARLAKCTEIIDRLKSEANFAVSSTQSLINSKGINECETANLNGNSMFMLLKRGLFGKPKVCYYITRTKDEITVAYLDQIFDELRRQASGENIFNAPDYKT